MLQRGDTLKEQAFALIREKILRQELPMGSHLNIAAMSRELKISNSPLRESIALLEQEGLVENTSNAGFRIVKLDAQKMTQLTQAFLVLLDGCYMDCIRKGKTQLLTQKLQQALQLQQEALTKDNTYEYSKLAVSFDRCFVDACENTMLSNMFNCKFDLLMIAALYVYQEDSSGIVQNLDEHVQLYHAVSENDVELVRKLLAEHYNKTYIF